ncbi:unnamed protein product [Caenorhabditis angaria]|uniref:G-protein coupled receptors family 1 profile domain-containing protein n=1 Tax=Caenorhabditis angaria TaxID=860376 RepID=A0A9P1J2I4_9PELO|nr:unnamed protein product [Caenorhabditis angaria]
MSTEESSAPTYLISDYIEIVYLCVVICLGVPANLVSIWRLIRERKIVSNRDPVKSGFVMLKIHLNITDFLILIHAIFKTIWLISYGWYANSFFCKIFQMFSIFSLYSSANIVVCIALDRLRNVVNANKLHTKSRKINAVTILVTCSWVFAFICSIPQYFFFETIEVTESFTQCSDIWQISKFNSTQISQDSLILSDVFANGYNIAHLVLVFWGPLIILIITYAFIATRVMKYSLRRPGAKQQYKQPNTTISNECQKDLIIHIDAEDGNFERRSSLKQFVRCSAEEIVTSDRKHRRDAKIHANSSPRVPTWRKQIRGRVFRTTILVILTHFLFWFPYNAYGLMRHVNVSIFETLSAHVHIFKDLQILITLINPFLYGFSS